MTEKEKALYNKLKALAEKGVGGEAENAKAFLVEFVKKHPEFQDFQDKDSDVVKRRCFYYSKSDEYSQKLMYQLLCKEFGKERFCNGILIRYSGTKRRREIKGEVYFDCTDEEWLRVTFLYSFYYKRWKEKLAIFYSAFIQKNELGVKNSGKDSLSREEREKLFRMMHGFDADVPDSMNDNRLKGNDTPLLGITKEFCGEVDE